MSKGMSKIVTNVPEHLFNLPLDFEPDKEKAPEQNRIPNVDSLTPSQRKVYDIIIKYFADKLTSEDIEGLTDLEPEQIRMIVLKGYAGTGKTYLSTQVLKWYVMMMQNNVAVCAPTNKAVKVIKRAANFTHSLIDYSTVHRCYGLKEKINEATGARTFEPEWGEDNKIDNISAMVHDETSMLPDSIYKLIEESNRRIQTIRDSRVLEVSPGDMESIFNKLADTGAKQYRDNMRVLLMGDPIQIPPVGKTDCIPFITANEHEYGLLTLEMTEVIRQKEGNPILDLATLVRQNYQKATLPYKRETQLTEQGGVCFINSGDKDVLYRLCEVYFTNPRFKFDSDFMKVIAWTNKTVNFMNKKIRQYIHKEVYEKLVNDALSGQVREIHEDEIRRIVELPRILIGEKLIADKPILEDLGYKVVSIFSTSDEFEVVSYTIEKANVFSNYEVSVYNTKVLYHDETSNKSLTKNIRILHENDTKNFDNLLLQLKNSAIRAPKHERGQSWKLYYMTESKFAAVNYNYAITAHKSQGSTYQNSVVIVADMDANTRVEERNRIKYVAFTRAKEHLFIVE